MNNIADLIENYILQKLCTNKNRNIILKRTDIADAINCAPSQISYVLNTRFTLEKGFLVESRRGLGGYIRIEKKPLDNLIYHKLKEKITENFSKDDLHFLLTYMLKNKLIEKREAAIFLQTFEEVHEKISQKDCRCLFQSLLNTLAEFIETKNNE